MGCAFIQNDAALVCFHTYEILLFISFMLKKKSKQRSIVKNTKMVAEAASL